MRKKPFIRILLLVFLIAGAFIILRSSKNSPKNPDCKDMKQICNKCDKPPANPQNEGMIWENLSRQFSS